MSTATRIWELRLPLPDWPAARIEGDYGLSSTKLWVEGEELLHATSREQLLGGLEASVGSHRLRFFLDEGGETAPVVEVDGRRAIEERDLHPAASASARWHAVLAFAASVAGFIASYLYLERAWEMDSVWSLKMAYHMAGWHLLLTFVLAPAALLFGRLGIRTVQVTSALFFAIHLGIALANLGDNAGLHHGGAIAFWNAVSGVFFLAAVGYGQVAWRDMDPVRALTDLR